MQIDSIELMMTNIHVPAIRLVKEWEDRTYNNEYVYAYNVKSSLHINLV